MRGRGTGIEIDARLYSVYAVRDGEVARMDEYATRAGALEAVGLRE
jgi:ketosteroid isomerase-like protein